MYENLRVSDLQYIAKSRGLRGWSKLKKDDLVSFITDNEEYPTDRVTEDARKMGKKTIKELKTLAQIHDVKTRSKANKNEIIYLLGENYGEKRRAYFERIMGIGNQSEQGDYSMAKRDSRRRTKAKTQRASSFQTYQRGYEWKSSEMVCGWE